MGTLTVNATNGQTVAAGASYLVPYPAGTSEDDYLTTGAKITTSDGSIYDVTASMSASGITVTNPTGRSIASGGFDFMDLTSNEFAVTVKFNALTGGIDFSGKLAGNLASGEWFNPPSIFRLLLNGTGTVTIDSKDAAGTIKTGVYSTTLSSAVNEIAFPYAGDNAIQIRATLTGTATAKVI
jgi:hypothetical protein